MSVLIKDMEKPKSCYTVIDEEYEYCPFVNTDDDCVLLLEKGICEGTWADQYSKCPLAEEPERKKGKWDDIGGVIRYGCPFCHNAQERKSNFCPNCGADMRGEEDENNVTEKP